MPTQEYRCKECGCEFTVVASACEIGESSTRCPKCDSGHVERVVGPALAAKTPPRS